MKQLLKSVHNSKYPLVFGGGAISGEGGGYGFGDITESDAISLLEQVYELGITIFDTAPIYGFGESEKRMGKAFSKIRDKVFIISKAGITWHENHRVDLNNDPKVIQKMLEQSLRDLNSDYIDLYMIHWPDHRVDIRHSMEVLSKAKGQGKINHIGLCNTNMNEIQKALEIDEIEAIQSELNIFESESFDEVKSFVEEKEISFMSWGTFDKGIITGRVTEDRTFDKSDSRSWAPWWKKSNYKLKIEIMKEILPLLSKHGFNGVDLALSFNLSRSGILHAVCGGRSVKQWQSIAKSLSNPMNKVLLEQIVSLINAKNL